MASFLKRSTFVVIILWRHNIAGELILIARPDHINYLAEGMDLTEIQMDNERAKFINVVVGLYIYYFM